MKVPYAQMVLGQGVRLAVENLKQLLKGWRQQRQAFAVILASALLVTASLELYLWMERGPDGFDRPAAILSAWVLAAAGGVLTVLALASALWTVERRCPVHRDTTDGTHEDTSTVIGRDGLTGLLDRRGFLLFAEDALACFQRYDWHFATLLVQLDERPPAFREPGMVDCVLRHVADVLDLSLRKTDKVSRFGGELFAVLLREISERDAIMLAERMRARVESFAAAFGSQSIPVTVSMGVSVACRDDDTIGKLLARTESFLNEARRSGPNQVGWQAPADQPDRDPGATIVPPDRAVGIASLPYGVALSA